MIPLLTGIALAADGASTVGVTPWNGAALTFTQDGGALDASLAGPLGKSWAVSGQVSVPFDLSAVPGTGMFRFDAELTRTPTAVAELCSAASLGDCGDLVGTVTANPADAAELADALRKACDGQGLTGDDCSTDKLDEAARTQYVEALSGTRTEIATFFAKETARATARSFFASPLDQLAKGQLAGRTVGSYGVVLHGEMNRFTAYEDATDGSAGTYGDASVSLGAHLGFSSGTAASGSDKRVGGGALFDLSVVGSYASSQPVDTSSPERAVVAGAPAHALGGGAALELVVVGRELPTGSVLNDASYAPIFGLSATGTAADLLAADIAAGTTVDVSISGGLRPVSNGAGLTLGALVHYGRVGGEAGWSVLPVATISGELPDLGATGLKGAVAK